jgi:hypothetical protein
MTVALQHCTLTANSEPLSPSKIYAHLPTLAKLDDR